MGCQHRWIIEATQADEAEGQCYNCGEIRTFRNQIDKQFGGWPEDSSRVELQFAYDCEDHYVPWGGPRIDLSLYEGIYDGAHRGYWYPRLPGAP